MTDRAKRLNLRDVAAVAGVSEMTVSRVQNRRGVVSARTRERVEAAIERMGYVPNRLAGSLARSTTEQVAVIIPSLSNLVFDEVLEGIAKTLASAGMNPLVGVTNYDPMREEALLLSMLSWRPAGVILPAIEHTARSAAALKHSGLPVVEVMNTARAPIDIAVGIDQRAAGAALASHLWDRGHRIFVYAGRRVHDVSGEMRFAALAAEIADRGGIVRAPPAEGGVPVALAEGKQALAAILESDSRPDVVVFANDTAAAGGIMHCMERGVAVPDDIGIAGYGGLTIGRALPDALTTIRTDREAIGRIAAECVLRRIDGAEVAATNIVPFALVAGSTS